MFKKREREKETTTVGGVTTERPGGIRSASAWHGTASSQLSCPENRDMRHCRETRPIDIFFFRFGIGPIGISDPCLPISSDTSSFLSVIFFFLSSLSWVGEGGDKA